MARYIDADKYLKELEIHICNYCIDEDDHCGSCAVGCARAIAREMPTADIAREIFEEIEKLIDSHEITIGLVYDEGAGATTAIDRINKKIAELKKKYTEGE